MHSKFRAESPTEDAEDKQPVRAGSREAGHGSTAPPSFLEKPEPAEAPSAAPLDRSNLQIYLQEIGKTPLLTIAEEVTPRAQDPPRATRRPATT